MTPARRQTTLRRAIAQAETALDAARRMGERIARRIDALDVSPAERFKRDCLGLPTEADRRAAERFAARIVR